MLSERPAEIRKKRGRAVDEVIALLDAGILRVCEPVGGGWVTHAWIKRAILMYFQRLDSVVVNRGQVANRRAELFRQAADETQLQGSRRALRSGRHRALRGVSRPRYHFNAGFCQYWRVRRRRVDGRHLGDGRLVRADRQERSPFGRCRDRRCPRTAAGPARHHRRRRLHRLALHRGRRRPHRTGGGAWAPAWC